jgi:hypothetical protein
MLASLMLVMSCATSHMITIDETVPKNESAVVLFDHGVKVRTFNNVDVFDAWYGRGWWTADSAKITVPAGEAKIEYDVYLKNNDVTYEADNLNLTYTFEAGKEYIFKIDSQGGILGIFHVDYGIALYDKLPHFFIGTTGRKPIEFWVIEF